LAGDKPIDVVYSHADWDHCWGTAALHPDSIIAHDACAARFQSGEVAKSLGEKKAQEPNLWDAVELIPPTLTFNPSLTLDCGGVQVELHHLPGHTEDCLVAWIPQWGVLLAGDTIETPLPYLNPESVALLPAWISALEKWNATPRMNVVIPAHGEVGDRSLIERNLTYLRALQAGQPPAVPAEMTAFYTETHASNMAFMGIGR
jgi:glyoxylase-like metal-dependent hydrolase (beta-lactamase superfamily II)